MSHAAPGYLRPYLRTLWRQAPAIGQTPAAPSARAILGDGVLLVPPVTPESMPAERRRLQLATAAHAGAHVRFGRGAFQRGTLKPVQTAVLGLLEDARVEWLAARELPGLRPLWLGCHSHCAGEDFESLLQRLSHALLEPAQADPHPWVAKARRLFFDDAAASRLADLDPAGLRQVASVLGNDIGQMRLQFNARLYVVQPAYRDDNAHLWQEDVRLVPAPRNDARGDIQPLQDVHDPPPPPAAGPHPPAEPLLSPERGVTYPEWDRLIRRLRPGWVTVQERGDDEVTLTHEAAHGREHGPAGAERLQDALRGQAGLARRLQRLLASSDLARRPAPGHDRAEDGEDFDLDAVIRARIARRAGMPPDARVHLRAGRSSDRLCVLIMLDASWSTARAAADGTGPVLQSARLAALLLASALEAEGHGCAVQAFSSNGRHQVLVQPVKQFEEACADFRVLTRAQALRSRWSTRVGAAVRHAAAAVGSRPEPVKMVLLVTDGEPHDVDVHDPRYLVDDLRQAVKESARRGVQLACVDIGGSGVEAGDPLRASFPSGAYRTAAALKDFPAGAAAALRSARWRS